MENETLEKKIRLLVIEDDQKHLEDAKKYFSSLQGIDVTYAGTYSEANQKMFKYEDDKKVKGVDGVISDIFFPYFVPEDSSDLNPGLTIDDFKEPQPVGVAVAIDCSKAGIPFVLNTAGYHHGIKYEWIHGLAGSQKWDIIDRSPRDDVKFNDNAFKDGEAVSKNWELAYKTLLGKLNREPVQ